MIHERYLAFKLTDILEGGNQTSTDFYDFIRILLAQEQDIKIWSDGMYVSVEYDHSDRDFGGPYLEWIDPAKEYIQEYDVEPEEDLKEKEEEGDEEIPQPDNVAFISFLDKPQPAV